MENYISKQDAIAAMRNGNKVKHRLFDANEYIYMKEGNNLNIFFEDGNYEMWYKFWEIRQGDIWNNGWSFVYNYMFQVQFKGQEGNLIRVWDIVEEFETMEQIKPFMDILDKTVSKSRVVNLSNNQVCWQYFTK